MLLIKLLDELKPFYGQLDIYLNRQLDDELIEIKSYFTTTRSELMDFRNITRDAGLINT